MAFVENQTGKTIKILRTDNGSEFCNKEMRKCLESKGIRHQTTTPYTPEQNGVAERMNRTIVERARCLLFDASLPKALWAEAVSTSVYLINRSPNRSLPNKTPFELWSGAKPDMSHIRVFGSQAMTHIPKEKRKKFDSKSEELVFVGYCEDTKGYRLLRMGTKTIVKSRDVIFIENRKESQGKYLTNQHIVLLPDPEVLTTEEGNESENNEKLSSGSEMFFGFPEEDQDMNLNSSDSLEDCSDSFEDPSVEVRRSTRARKETVFYPNPVTYMSADTQSFDDPNSVRELEERSDAEVWKQAMKEE